MEPRIKKTFSPVLSPAMMYYIFIFFLPTLLLNADTGFAEDALLNKTGYSDSREYLKNGKSALEAGNYADAVKNLSVAQKEFKLLEDFALYYLSDAYHKLGEHEKSLEAIQTLIERHPDSPLMQKARSFEIREAGDSSNENLLQLFKSYIKDYPKDKETHFMFGLFLKGNGDKARAKYIFKKIYIEAEALSSSAYAELKPPDIKASDLIERASNLIKRYEFEEAEHDLRKALSMQNKNNRDEILRHLGFSLFKQKKYKEASEIYDKIHDIYFKSRSLYRAGDKKGFDLALNELLTGDDRRAGFLLVAVASDSRREADFENALKIYTDVLNKYPSEKEDALWGIGWTYYVSGDYGKAAETFSKLYSTYEDPKYLYWQARSIEASGGNASDFYDLLMKIDNNFYSFFSYIKNNRKIIKSASFNKPVFNDASSGEQVQAERVEALISLGMSREAVSELIYFSKKINSSEELMYIMSKFHELGEFKRALNLAAKMPYSEKLQKFWYPLAFWDIVEQVSRKYDIDPFIALSIIREESRYDTEAKSVAGARGLMQIMPQTAYRLDKNLKLGITRASQINDVKNNLYLGTHYLRSLFNEFSSLAHVLAAYNAGEVIVRKWEQRGRYKSVDEFIEDIPYPETRNYVKKVLTSYFQYKKFSSGDADEINLDSILGKL